MTLGYPAGAYGLMKAPTQPKHILVKDATIWTIGSWAFLAFFVIPWDLQGWTGQMLVLGSLAATAGLAITIIRAIWIYFATQDRKMTRDEKIGLAAAMMPVWLLVLALVAGWLGW